MTTNGRPSVPEISLESLKKIYNELEAKKEAMLAELDPAARILANGGELVVVDGQYYAIAKDLLQPLWNPQLPKKWIP